MPHTNPSRVTIRVSLDPRTAAMLDATAGRHARTVSGEARLAIARHVHLALRRAIDERDPALISEIESEQALADLRTSVQAELEAIEAIARRRPPAHVLQRAAAALN